MGGRDQWVAGREVKLPQLLCFKGKREHRQQDINIRQAQPRLADDEGTTFERYKGIRAGGYLDMSAQGHKVIYIGRRGGTQPL